MNAAASHLLCESSAYPELPLVLESVRNNGFSAIELGAFEKWGQGLSPARLCDDETFYAEAVSTLSGSPLQVPSLNVAPGPDLLLQDDAGARYAAELGALTRLALAVGARHITLQVPKAPDTWDTPRIVEEFSARIIRAIESIPDHERVHYAVEAHAQTFMEDPATALAVMERTYPTLGLTYDPSHQIMIGVPLEQTEPLFAFVTKGHLRDARRGEMQAPWGEGELDPAWVLTKLAEHGYNDYVTAEYFGGFDPEFVSARAAKEFIEAFEP